MREAIRETMRGQRPDGEAEYWQVRLREGWLRHIDARTSRTRRERQEQMKVLAFVVKTTDGLFVRLLLGAAFSGLLAAGITLLVASEGTGEWPPQQLTYVAMVTIGVIVALTGQPLHLAAGRATEPRACEDSARAGRIAPSPPASSPPARKALLSSPLCHTGDRQPNFRR